MAVVVGRFAGSELDTAVVLSARRARTRRSNGHRFQVPAADAADRQRFSVVEPAPDDALNLNDYYDPRVLAPLHLINVTLNQTVDPAEQLVQRDRKASRGASDRPALVQPGGAQQLPADAYVRFTVDGRLCRAIAAAGQQSRTGGQRWRRRVPSATGSPSRRGGVHRPGSGIDAGHIAAAGLANLRLASGGHRTWHDGPPQRHAASRRRQGHDAPGMLARLFRTQW
jgi:hypothetical protein